MPYVRLSIARPRKGRESQLEELQATIAGFLSRQPGCERSYLLKPNDGSGEIARLTIWDDEASAERAANLDRMLSLRSEVHLISEPGHTERAFNDIPYSAPE